MLEKSWAKTFADKVFPAIDENIFSVLYSKKASRPNTPVNVIVGALILKEALNVMIIINAYITNGIWMPLREPVL